MSGAWLLVVLTLVLAGCSGGDSTSTSTSTAVATSKASTTPASAVSPTVPTATGTAVATATASATPTVVAPPRRVVVLDPGHGGDEPGATGGGIVERESNLEMAERIAALLSRDGIDVVLTRTTADRPRVEGRDPDLVGATATFLDLQDRIAIANASAADVFVSIHSNGCVSPEARGVEVWFDSTRTFSAANRSLAEAILAAIAARTGTSGATVPVHGIEDDVGVADSAGHTTPLLVLGPSRDMTWDEIVGRGIDPRALGLGDPSEAFRTDESLMPAVVVELLYLTNPSDAALLADEAVRDALASGVAGGIERYLAQRTTGVERGTRTPAMESPSAGGAPRSAPAGCAPR